MRVTNVEGMLPVPAIILFDGVCHLCNGAVAFILKRDKTNQFRFATTQSQAAADLVVEHHIAASLEETFVLIEDKRVHYRSDAALEIADRLGWPWKVLVTFRVLPQGFRDWFYDRIARNRYRWFGRRDVCMVPGDDVRHRFLE